MSDNGPMSDLRERLMAFLRKPGCAYTSDRLYELTSPESERAFNEAMHAALACGEMTSYVVVESPFGGGIAEYPTVTDVPEFVDDWHNEGEPLRVRPEMIRVYYKLKNGA